MEEWNGGGSHYVMHLVCRAFMDLHCAPLTVIGSVVWHIHQILGHEPFNQSLPKELLLAVHSRYTLLD